MVRRLATLSPSDPRLAETLRELSENMNGKLEELHYGSTEFNVDCARIAQDSCTGLVTPLIQAAIEAFCLVHTSAVTES